MKTLADQVRLYMEHADLNAPQMAKLVGTSRQNIENLVAGSVRNPKYLGALAKVMCTSADALLRGEYSPGHPQDGGYQHAGVAQLMSPRAVTVPHVLAWEAVVQSKKLPDEFAVKMPDGALGDRVPEGTALIFKRAATARPRQCVLIEDREGQRYIRRYAQGSGSTWYAQALDDAYISLHSETHGLRVLAVMTWREGGEI